MRIGIKSIDQYYRTNWKHIFHRYIAAYLLILCGFSQKTHKSTIKDTSLGKHPIKTAYACGDPEIEA